MPVVIFTFCFHATLTVVFSSWVVIPVWLMLDAYKHIAGSLRVVQTSKQHKVE